MLRLLQKLGSLPEKAEDLHSVFDGDYIILGTRTRTHRQRRGRIRPDLLVRGRLLFADNRELLGAAYACRRRLGNLHGKVRDLL